MTESTPKLPANKRFYCNTCRTDTHHNLKATHSRQVSFEEEAGWWEEEYFLFWVCAGCDTATLERKYTHAGMSNEDGDQIYDPDEFFPKRSERDVAGKRFKRLPKKLDTIYRQTLVAYNNGLDILCAAGLRALIEGICADKGTAGRNLEKQIDNLVGLLPGNIVSSLHGFRFIGNIAVHELSAPGKNDLQLAIEVSEDLLNFLYELDYKASRLPKPTKAISPA